MIFYIEKKYLHHPIVQNNLKKFPRAQYILIDNYKNIFDKNIQLGSEKIYVFAGVNNALLEAPIGYGFSGKGYFLKNSLNCIYDCSYCYLKGAFKNETQVFFINYDEIKKQLQELIQKNTSGENIYIYSSDYSDNLATEQISAFCENMLAFIDTLPNTMMEIRTKSNNIAHLRNMSPALNTEIAFSLNPQEVITRYEHKTPSLDTRISAINELLGRGWKVGIRFLPLLEFPGYQEIYTRFLGDIRQRIDFTKIHSVFIGGLMFTHDDYNVIQKKYPKLDVLYRLQKNSDGFYRETPQLRQWFYSLFKKMLPEQVCHICLDIEK